MLICLNHWAVLLFTFFLSFHPFPLSLLKIQTHRLIMVLKNFHITKSIILKYIWALFCKVTE